MYILLGMRLMFCQWNGGMRDFLTGDHVASVHAWMMCTVYMRELPVFYSETTRRFHVTGFWRLVVPNSLVESITSIGFTKPKFLLKFLLLDHN